jgi:hypothetical protein
MKILAGLIRRKLRLQAGEYGHCAVYEDELQRVWPIDEDNRKAKIQQFAEQNGFRLVYYKRGLCAMFEPKALNNDSKSHTGRAPFWHRLKRRSQKTREEQFPLTQTGVPGGNGADARRAI